MADFTGRFGLEMPTPDDNYDIEAHARNLAKLSSALKSNEIAELKIITQADFNNTEKKTDTLYLVVGENGFSLYLGDKPLMNNGTVVISTTLRTDLAAVGSVHNAEMKEEA